VGETLITAMTGVFDAVMDWLLTAINSVISLFWAEGALTFLGILSLVALAISIFFLIVRLIQNFLHLRG
jgi:hypothetical protein